ncbi:hypothetical protein ACO0LO_05030 [Undibacterium sp. TJN25]|uniref:hypothetical protein n=1 Tax=Undibacterium sp. TJN25 TaxID=3413056 RepID=UPI003BF14191
MDEIWLKQGDHWAVKRYDQRDDIGILYLPEGSQMVYSGDVIVLDDDGVYRVGNCSADTGAEGFGELDLSGITAEALADSVEKDAAVNEDVKEPVPGGAAEAGSGVLE